MDFSWVPRLDPDKASVQTATAAGSFVALLLTRRYGWAHALTLFVVGQITAFYWTVPLAAAFHLDNMTFVGPIGFSIGAIGMLVWGAVIALAQNLMDDPKGTLTWAWRTWKGDK